ncbi:IS5 family transposase [Janthinobacterium lividum]|uniref:IS5 family transposase n=1 Tax=Janthinobacterium lividum TaxID=29581 RepID=UPI00140AADEE|nr:IS5 family transposase [Janthinobacterium lividum]NHQ90309.1 IS5 family transposase [Janthinobacterium lividum]
MATKHSLGSTAPSSSAGGRPPELKPEHIAVLHEIVQERAQASLQEIADELYHRCALRVCTATIRRALRALGLVRLKPLRRKVTVRAEGAKRYGYTAAHRREAISPYSTNLTDAEWELVADLFERTPGQRGTPVHYSRRDLVNACSYVLRTGCAWRLLPETFPPWQAVYKAFSRWVGAGVFEQMQDRLREQWRVRMGRASTPSAAIIDAQSTRISPQGGESGFDAGKKVKGRKRHLVVDTMGLIIAVSVTAASVQDRDAAATVVTQACSKSPRLERLYTDGAYGGKCAQAIEQAQHIRVEVVRHPANGTTGTLHDPKTPPEDAAAVYAGFRVLPMRWVVERTHAWMERWRRTVMHHDRKLTVSAAWVWLAEARMLLNRLAFKR